MISIGIQKNIIGKTQRFTSGGPFWDKDSNTFKIPSETEPITVETNYYDYTVEENIELYDTLIAESKTYEADQYEKNYPMFYWLASRDVCFPVNYNVYTISEGKVSGWCLVESDSDFDPVERFCGLGVRPIITLKSSVQIDKSDTSKDGSEESKAYILK